MPSLNSSSSEGKYGAIIVIDAASYQYESGWASAITTDMWDQIYEYQLHFHARLVRINEFPSPQFGKQYDAFGLHYRY